MTRSPPDASSSIDRGVKIWSVRAMPRAWTWHSQDARVVRQWLLRAPSG